jgi:hypothetical protein
VKSLLLHLNFQNFKTSKLFMLLLITGGKTVEIQRRIISYLTYSSVRPTIFFRSTSKSYLMVAAVAEVAQSVVVSQ